MATPTPLKPAEPAGLTLQKVRRTSRTRRRRTWKLTLLYLLIVAAGVAAAVWAYHHFQPAVLTHPDFDDAAVSGAPEVEERYGYSALTVDEGYQVYLCGVPANDGETVELFLTNPEDNTVWFRCEILDADGQVLASSGVLRPGEYLPSLTLSEPLTERETPVTVRVVSYEPDTWRSRGNVNLNLTLYKDFS